MNLLKTIGVLSFTLLLSAPVAAQTVATPWTVTTKMDPMTDTKVLTATIIAADQSSPSLTYELTLTCTGDHIMDVAINTFDQTAGRPIPWQERTTVGRNPIFQSQMLETTKVWVAMRFRQDSQPITSIDLEQTYANGGQLPRIGWIVHDAKGWATGWEHLGLPQTRLLVADIFPGETIAFPFDTLTVDQRAQMIVMCRNKAS